MIHSFLYQTHGTKNKNNVLKNPRKDGYGFAALANKWGIWKSPQPYYEEPNIKSIVSHLSDNFDYIIGHIRDADTKNSPPSLENTHPFLYGNNIIVHNGYLMNQKGEKINGVELEKEIDIKYRSLIKGNTDTERIFYLLIGLSVKYRNNWTRIFDEFFQIINKHYTKYKLTFVFARGDNILFAKIASNTLTPLSLYFNLEKGHIGAISSEPVMENYQLVPEGHVYLYNVERNTLEPVWGS